MKKLIVPMIFTFCALVSKDIKAQSTHWQGISAWSQWGWAITETFYEDTSADLLYLGKNKVYAYDGNTFTALGSLNSSGGVRQIIKYNDTLYASAFDVGLQLMKWNGSIWDTTGLSSNGGSVTMYVYNGDLYVGGNFTTIGGINASGLAKYNGTSWSAVGNFPFSYQYGVSSISSYNGELYIGGVFGDSLGNDMNIARWNGSNWHSVGGGFHGGIASVDALEVLNNILYIGGSFTVSSGNVGNDIAQWNGTILSGVGGGMSSINTTNAQVMDLMQYNNSLYAVGCFQYAGGVFADHIAKWDGVNWCGFGDTLDNIVLALGTYRSELYIGGAFDTIGGDTICSVAKWIGGNYVDTCGVISTGVNEQAGQNFSVQVFPNPLNQNGTFQINGLEGNKTVVIYDQLGKEIWRKETNENQIEFLTENFTTGMYFYRLELNGEIKATGKFIVE